MKSELLHELEERGFIYQASNMDGLLDVLTSGVRVSLYYGSDPTGDSLHVGHIVPIMMMRWFQRYGHRPIMLVGGATGRIGDPSGRDNGRPVLSESALSKNLIGLRKSYEKILGNDDFLTVDNYDWHKNFGHLEFLSEFGTDFTVPRMLSMESVKRRLENGMSFLEFNYMTFQAVDFLELYKKHNCVLQICGSDQWGNCIMGVELIRKKLAKEAFVLSTPLITDAQGNKIGKSAGNAVWVNEDKTTPYEYYQYFRNVTDADVEKFLKIYTELTLDEIAKLAKLKDAELNEAKKILAFEATKIAHGKDAANAAAAASAALFAGAAVASATVVASAAPSVNVKAKLPMSAIDFAMLSGLFPTKSEARRTIGQGGLSVNGRRVLSVDEVIEGAGEFLVQKGKKTFVKVVVNS
ncbi:MAG: tyrosine--tRNA ligase [Rickettsiales bacterium]|jgi:tyrosyl-tRNA synthetase|nr:tyrosine--tRNA ligase [Rickettsiales bacterium]